MLGLDLTVYTYVQETMKVISVIAIFKSLLKSVVFAVLIAGIGCEGGSRSRGGRGGRVGNDFSGGRRHLSPLL